MIKRLLIVLGVLFVAVHGVGLYLDAHFGYGAALGIWLGKFLIGFLAFVLVLVALWRVKSPCWLRVLGKSIGMFVGLVFVGIVVLALLSLFTRRTIAVGLDDGTHTVTLQRPIKGRTGVLRVSEYEGHAEIISSLVMHPTMLIPFPDSKVGCLYFDYDSYRLLMFCFNEPMQEGAALPNSLSHIIISSP